MLEVVLDRLKHTAALAALTQLTRPLLVGQVLYRLLGLLAYLGEVVVGEAAQRVHDAGTALAQRAHDDEALVAVGRDPHAEPDLLGVPDDEAFRLTRLNIAVIVWLERPHKRVGELDAIRLGGRPSKPPG